MFLHSDSRVNFSQGLITQLTGKLFIFSIIKLFFVKGKKECILESFQLLQESGIVYNICHCGNVLWKGVL